MRKIRIGTRESRLAVLQAEIVADYIRRCCEGKEPQLVTMKTAGDRILDRTLDRVGGKGLFVRELELSLREGALAHWSENFSSWWFRFIEAMSKHYGFSLDVPLRELSPEHLRCCMTKWYQTNNCRLWRQYV